MTDERKRSLHTEIDKRIEEKKQLRGGSVVLQDINKSIEKYPELSYRERDFAFRYALEHRTYQQWANFYGVSYRTVQDMMNNPRVRQLISEIQFNIRAYAVGMQMYLLREAMQQYARIFAVPEVSKIGVVDPEILSVKERAADKIMKFVSVSGGKKEDPEDKREVNINIFSNTARNEQQERVVSDFGPGEKVTIEDVEQDLENFRKTTALRKQIEKYAGKNSEGENYDDK